MKRFGSVIICLAAIALSSCLGQTNRWASDDGYVFYRYSMRYTSKGEQLGYIVSEIEVDGVKKKVVKVSGGAAYREGGTVYFVCQAEGEEGQFLCYCNVGDTVGKVLARGHTDRIFLFESSIPCTKIAVFNLDDGVPRFLRDGEIIELEEGILVCPEGDGHIVEGKGGCFYVEAEERWGLPDYADSYFIDGWMLYYRAKSGYFDYYSFDMRTKKATKIEGRHSFAGCPFSVKEAEGGVVFCRWDGEGRAEERFLGVEPGLSVSFVGGAGVFRLGDGSWVYDYAFDKLTPCIPGKPGYFAGDFSYYEDEDYRFYVRNVYEEKGYIGPTYYRLNKKTGADEFLYRPAITPVSGGGETTFPRADWVLPPNK